MAKPCKNRGRQNFKSKLTEVEVLAIYRTKGATQDALAARHGVSQSTINHIKQGRTWAWLTGHPERKRA